MIAEQDTVISLSLLITSNEDISYCELLHSGHHFLFPQEHNTLNNSLLLLSQ